MTPRRPKDTNQLAKHIVDLATDEIEEKPREKDPRLSEGVGRAALPGSDG